MFLAPAPWTTGRVRLWLLTGRAERIVCTVLSCRQAFRRLGIGSAEGASRDVRHELPSQALLAQQHVMIDNCASVKVGDG